MSHTKTPHLIHQKYRADIDGLRAIAILPVVLFHAFPGFMPGGFIGVDIFFVISGFLISTIIFSSLERNRFSIVEFYIRRIRRIFPALILVLAASAILGWLLMFPGEYKQLGKHTVASVGFFQNLILWQETGYFDNSAETKPLLHLWSLAVEEQFYIFWPLLLAFVWNRNWNFLKITAAIGLVSFAANIYLMLENRSAAFYLPLPRFWELMIGGILAFAVLHKPGLLDRRNTEQSIVGIILIIISIFLLDKERNFPGWWAILPTVGAFFMISAGPGAWVNQKILSNKTMVLIGLISYPLYLWHWVLLSYLRIVIPDNSNLETIITLIAAVLLSVLTYKFVENPFRLGGKSTIKTLVLLACISGIGLSGAYTWYREGATAKNINNKLEFLNTQNVFAGSRKPDGSCRKLNRMNNTREEVCLSNSAAPQVLFVGDSHAMALYSSIFSKDTQLSSILISGHSCPIFPYLIYKPTYEKPWGNNCTVIANRAVAVAAKYPSIKTVVMMNHGGHAVNKKILYKLNDRTLSPINAFTIGYGGFIEKMLSINKNVVFVKDVPRLKHEPWKCIQRTSLIAPQTKCGIERKEVEKSMRKYNTGVRILRDKYPDIKIFNTIDIFCDSTECKSSLDGRWAYNDKHHISIFASKYLLKKMLDEGYISQD